MNWRVVFYGADGIVGAKTYYGGASGAAAFMNFPPPGSLRVELQREVDICCGNKEWVVTYERMIV